MQRLEPKEDGKARRDVENAQYSLNEETYIV
jgi:hypothetical protein